MVFPVNGTLVEHHHLHFLKTVYYFKLILFNLFKLTLLFILLIKSCLFFTFLKNYKNRLKLIHSRFKQMGRDFGGGGRGAGGRGGGRGGMTQAPLVAPPSGGSMPSLRYETTVRIR